MINLGSNTIFFDNFPMPPSENNLYKNVPFGQRGLGRCKTRDHKIFINQVEIYKKVNRLNIKKAQDLMQKWINNKRKFSIMSQYFFPKSMLYTLKGDLKRLDASNRVKPVNDQISNLLGIDDKLFLAGSYRKLIGELHTKVLVIAE